MYHLSHRLRIFLFYRKVILCSRDIQVFVLLTIPWFTKYVTSRVLVHETGWIFEYTFWNTTHYPQQTWSIDRCKQGQYFSEIFWLIWRFVVEFQALTKLATCSNYLLTNYVKFSVFHSFEKVNKGELKIANINY